MGWGRGEGGVGLERMHSKIRDVRVAKYGDTLMWGDSGTSCCRINLITLLKKKKNNFEMLLSWLSHNLGQPVESLTG